MQNIIYKHSGFNKIWGLILKLKSKKYQYSYSLKESKIKKKVYIIYARFIKVSKGK